VKAYHQIHSILIILIVTAISNTSTVSEENQTLTRIKFNHPGLVTDLGVGLWSWPLPMDWDSDGDLDLIVSCPDVPFNGIYFFENPEDTGKMPVFKAPVRIGKSLKNVRMSLVNGKPRVLTPGTEWTKFLGSGFKTQQKIHSGEVPQKSERIRANQWHYVDYNGDGKQDLIVGIGSWKEYGWDDAFDETGQWTNGPLHGFVYLQLNQGSNNEPQYSSPVKVTADGKPIDVYGMPSPNFADFDLDGDLDLICGEFMDGFTYFQNIGSRTEPAYASGTRLSFQGVPLAMHLQMITPTAIDWDRDGDMDLIVGDEDGRVALVENTGQQNEFNVPIFLPPVYFKQQADDLKFGALVTPVSIDWDGDGDEDLICGNTSGNIGFIENLNGGNPPKWAAPELLQADGVTIHIQAGSGGSIQGPCEAKWGYTTLSAADWNHDGLLDLVVNSIWGKILWFPNIGNKTKPQLIAAKPIEVEWEGTPPKPTWNWWNPSGKELVTQWRTTPVVVDWNQDQLNDLVMLDHEGYLTLFQRIDRNGQLLLLPGKRIFHAEAINQSGKHPLKNPLRLNTGMAGKSGRRKLCIVDWDGDGRKDILINSTSVDIFRNIRTSDGKTQFEKPVRLGTRKLAGHTTSPTTVNWNKDGIRDLLVGAEDGRFYFLKNTDH